MTLLQILLIAAGLLAGIGLGLLAHRLWSSKRLDSAERQVQRILKDAEQTAEAKKKEALLQAKEELYRTRTQFEKESHERRQELKRLEQRTLQREENVDRKVSFLDRKDNEIKDRERKLSDQERKLSDQERSIQRKEDQARALLDKQRIKLQRMSSLTQEEAKNLLMASMREEAERSAAILARQIESEARDKAEKEARNIIALAIQRYAGDQVSEMSVSTVPLPNDEMKGRIIGREGRNIRAFQAVSGVDVVVDDTPEVVVLSGFDPVRREIARISLERLVQDGRIHPPRIEEVVKKVTEEMENTLRETGEQAAFDVGIHGLKPEVIKLLGRLKYRTSYGQNVLNHSKEVAFVMGIMAAELGLDIQLAKKIGFLHDLGKAVDHEVEGSHAQIGATLAKKFGLPEVVVNAIAAHHAEVEVKTVYDILSQAGDAISAARPGARSETMGAYIKRLENLERLSMSFPGVKKAYAIQAGREVRVIVEPEKVDDSGMALVARNISKKIQDELDYPGQVKVTVVRETRAVEYAK